MSLQSGWRWCRKCNGLFFAANAGTKGACPEGGAHDDAGSSAYAVEHRLGADLGAGPIDGMQPRWRWCSKCQGLFYGGVGTSEVGSCPGGGLHKVGQANYLVPFAGVSGSTEAGWSWCASCYGLHKSSSSLGKCPAGSTHQKTGSGAYVLVLDATQPDTSTTRTTATTGVGAGTATATSTRTSAPTSTSTSRPTSGTTAAASSAVRSSVTATASSAATSTVRQTLESATSSAATPRSVETSAPVQVVYTTTTSRTVARKLLELSGQAPGACLASGGQVRADVVTTRDADGTPRKRLSAPRYADLLLSTCGEVSSSVRAWMKRSLEGDTSLVDGRVVDIDDNNRECSSTPLSQARLDAVRFPILNQASRDPISLELLVRNQGPTPRTVKVESSGAVHPAAEATPAPMLGKTKISLDGLNCAGILSASELILTRGVGEGGAATRFDVGNFTVHIMESADRSLQDWYNDFVVLGNNGSSRLKSGSITLYNARDQAVLVFSLSGVGVVDQTWSLGFDGRSNRTRFLDFELFCEQVRIV